MGIREDIAADFATVDGLEPVTFSRLNDEGIVIYSAPFPYALQRASCDDVEVDPELIANFEVTFWHLPAEPFRLAGIDPRKRDIIIDPRAITWVIWTVWRVSFRTRFRFLCLKE